jgi:hypothetical protein
LSQPQYGQFAAHDLLQDGEEGVFWGGRGVLVGGLEHLSSIQPSPEALHTFFQPLLQVSLQTCPELHFTAKTLLLCANFEVIVKKNTNIKKHLKPFNMFTYKFNNFFINGLFFLLKLYSNNFHLLNNLKNILIS